jgi:hypothetical protein
VSGGRQLVEGFVRSVDPSDVAREILAEDRFQPAETPAAVRRPLSWLGQQILDLFSPVGRALKWFFVTMFSSVFSGVIALIIFGFITFLIVRALQGRRRVQAASSALDAAAGVVTDPNELERQAALAAQNGNFAEAVRLRYVAGLRRLEQDTDVPATIASTNGKLRTEVCVAEFDQLSDDFDFIIYGERLADASHDSNAQQRWPQVQRLSKEQRTAKQNANQNAERELSTGPGRSA